MRISLTGHGNQSYEIRVIEVVEHDPTLINTMVDIDLMTFSEPTWSRYTAGLMLRHGRTFLLFSEQTPIGTCQCMRSWEDPTQAVLFSMAIRPGWRGQGLGTFFLQEVLDALATAGCKSVVLEVDPRSAWAIRLYEEKFGFEQVAECEDEYGPGHSRVHMRLDLKPPGPVVLTEVSWPTEEAAPESLPAPRCPPDTPPDHSDEPGTPIVEAGAESHS